METTSEPPFNLKHRATGAVILLSVPVLLLPWLLGGQNGQQPLDKSSLVPEPKSEFISSIGPAEDVPRASGSPDPNNSIEQKGRTLGDDAEPPASGASSTQNDVGTGDSREAASGATVLSGKETGWVVRVGVFSESENLKKRADLLSDNGMISRQETIEINGRAMVRIFLGPFPDLATAERESGKAMLVTGEPAFVVELN